MTTAHTPDSRAAVNPPTAQRSIADLVRAAVSGWLGTALEFMDFQLYSLAAALVFSQLFFSGQNAGMAVVLSMATYGVGYLARPLGAIFFGRLGDRIGRRKVLFYTIALMGAATTLIGVLPTYAQVGMLAPILLVALRLLQGFGAGAEISGAGVMLAEYAPAHRRGFLASWSGWAPTAAPCSHRRSGPSCWPSWWKATSSHGVGASPSSPAPRSCCSQSGFG